MELKLVKLKLGQVTDEKPTKITVEVPASLHADLSTYGQILGRESGQGPVDPVRLIIPMLQRFIATDRGFARAKHARSLPKSDD